MIRLAEVDFDNQTINMVALPRDLLVEIPADRFKVPGPYKINQAYFFGTPGMQNYLGEGAGPEALNEVIEYNFGVSADHYLVINFQVFVDFVDFVADSFCLTRMAFFRTIPQGMPPRQFRCCVDSLWGMK